MQRTAGRIMRWSGSTRRSLGPQVISMHVDVTKAEGAEEGMGARKMKMLHVYRIKRRQTQQAPLWTFLQDFFTRVGMNVNVLSRMLRTLMGFVLHFIDLTSFCGAIFSSNSSPAPACSCRCSVAVVNEIVSRVSIELVGGTEAKQIRCKVGFQRRTLICQIAAPENVMKEALFWCSHITVS